MLSKKEELQVREKKLNKILAQYFQKNGIRRLRLTSVGNSIASGYSIVRTTKPLLLRNESLEDMMNHYGVDVSLHHIARGRNNNDEHVFEWIESNIRESSIHKMNRADYSDGDFGMEVHGLDKEQMDEYYPINIDDDKGAKDLILESADDLTNIVIYNGATGSFLDAITRKGLIHQQLLYGVNRDVEAIQATLKMIQTNNRENKTNTQVYLCGVPNYLGLGIGEIINRKLKKIAKDYANVIYVEPIKAKMFYEELDDSSKKRPDLHYDEEEYIELNNAILKEINNNHQVLSAMIRIDRRLYHLSLEIEIIGNSDKKDEILEQILAEELEKIDYSKREEFLKEFYQYFIERSPYDYFPLRNDKVKSKII